MIPRALSAFLLDAQIPLLDGCLTPSLQSVLAESIFWAVLYIAYSQTFQRVLRVLFRKRRFWYTAHKRGGLFTKNAQDDLPAFFVCGVQHMFGGILMFLGVNYSDPALWRHGFLIETGFEVADLICMGLKLAPYNSGVKEEMIVPVIFHHIPGIIVAALIIESGLHENPHLSSIGMWLLLAGGIALLCAFYITTLDFDRDMKKAAFVNTANILCFLYARFIIFPWHSYHLMNDIRADPGFGTLFTASFAFYFIAMSIYNLGTIAELLPQGIRYVRRAMDGITVIDDRPVPPPKEGKMKQRRSSIIRMIHRADDALHEPSKKSEASSMRRFSAVLMPDPIFAAKHKSD